LFCYTDSFVISDIQIATGQNNKGNLQQPTTYDVKSLHFIY